MASHRRGPWSQAEDSYLVQLVHTQGALNWVRIAQLIGSRSPKQCRERYHQNLKPSLNHEPISPEEGLQIERLVAEMGKRWAEIARRLHGRSDNAVKNWWNGSMNRRRRLVLRRRTSSSSLSHTAFEEQGQSLSFARPAATALSRPLSINPTPYSTSRLHVETPLPSPSTSEASRAESVDAAPSLVSDTGSTYTTSPRGAPSPALELPPLNSFSSYRRPSLPALQFRTAHYQSEADQQATNLTPRFQGESKVFGMSTLSAPLYPSSERYGAGTLPREHHVDTGAQLLTASATPVQLPPIYNRRPELPAASRDSRMHLSSLLA